MQTFTVIYRTGGTENFDMEKIKKKAAAVKEIVVALHNDKPSNDKEKYTKKTP